MSSRFWTKAVERAVRRGTGASCIEDIDELQPVWGGNGMVFRVRLSGARIGAVVVKHVTLPPGTKRKRVKDRTLARTLDSYENELLFYRRYASEVSSLVRIPDCYAVQRLDDGWLFVLEDLVEGGFTLGKKSLSPQDISGALSWLARFHAAFLGHSGEGLWKSGSYWNLSTRQEEYMQMRDPKLKAAAPRLDAALNQCQYKTLIHGDAKTDNFCFEPSAPSAMGNVAGLDFQYVGRGCGMKDVMCLLDSCLSPNEAAARAPAHLEDYFDQLRAALHTRDASLDTDAIEVEWRSLHPIAWADYHRFLDGWAPGRYPPKGYANQMVQLALRSTDR